MNQLGAHPWELGLVCSSSVPGIYAVWVAYEEDPFAHLHNHHSMFWGLQQAYAYYDPNSAGFPLGVVKDHRPGSGARP